jgi:hypothetical protein
VDIQAEVQRMARRGLVPVIVPQPVPSFTGYTWFPAGWVAYCFAVPPHEKLHVRLYHPSEAWFRLFLVNHWGQRRFPGALSNVIATGWPEVRYENPTDAPMAVYVIVDDPGLLSSRSDPFTLKVDRSWDPARQPLPEIPKVLGVWAREDSLRADARPAEPAQPIPAQPAQGQPAQAQPAQAQPATVQPATVQPATAQPATAQPTVVEPAPTGHG